jgi:hypothetical protein
MSWGEQGHISDHAAGGTSVTRPRKGKGCLSHAKRPWALVLAENLHVSHCPRPQAGLSRQCFQYYIQIGEMISPIHCDVYVIQYITQPLKRAIQRETSKIL